MKTIPYLLATLAVTAISFAPQAGAQTRAPRHPNFITPEQLDPSLILPSPPADRTAAGEADLAEVHRLQATRTAADIAHAKADDAQEDMFIFQNILGEKFNAAALPQTALLSAHLHSDEGIIGNVAKKYFQRLRPFNFDSTVKPVCKTNDNREDYGYPSGHALTGYLEALTLIQIVPEKRDAILARADEYAHNRAVCGVHYASDGAASKLTAYAMIAIMMNNAQYQSELAAAKTETRRALGLSESIAVK
jgi:acid phosphatase (class A)